MRRALSPATAPAHPQPPQSLHSLPARQPRSAAIALGVPAPRAPPAPSAYSCPPSLCCHHPQLLQSLAFNPGGLRSCQAALAITAEQCLCTEGSGCVAAIAGSLGWREEGGRYGTNTSAQPSWHRYGTDTSCPAKLQPAAEGSITVSFLDSMASKSSCSSCTGLRRFGPRQTARLLQVM